MAALRSKGSEGLPGRDAGLAALAAVVADARAGRRGVVLLTGDAGMGKTSLLRAALGAVEGTVLWASGAEGEAHIAHGITDQLIRSSGWSTTRAPAWPSSPSVERTSVWWPASTWATR